MAEIWIDLETNLPVFARYEVAKQMGRSFTDTVSDIQWNVDFDPELFDATPPEGYTDITPKPPTLQQQGPQIIEALQDLRRGKRRTLS